MADIPSIAWISRGRLFVKQGAQPTREIESAFAAQSLQRQMRDTEQNAWKGRSGVWGNMGMEPPGMAPWENVDPRRQIRFVSVARGKSPDEIFYTLDMGAVGGLFSYNLKTNSEARLVHKQDFLPQNLSRHPQDGELVFSLPFSDGTVGLAVARHDGLHARSLTLTDSLDDAPTWMADGSKRVIFHSSMIGRNEQGIAIGRSPTQIETLDLENNEVQTLLAQPGFDLLQPRQVSDGATVFIRRPYQPRPQQQVSPLQLLQDIVFFPFRLARTFVAILHFLSVMFTGKPLITANSNQPNPNTTNPFLMLWGQAVDTRQAMGRQKSGDASTPLIPASWELIRRSADGTETRLATHVMTWDLNAAGVIIWTDGRSIWHLSEPSKPQSLATSDVIERIAILD